MKTSVMRSAYIAMKSPYAFAVLLLTIICLGFPCRAAQLNGTVSFVGSIELDSNSSGTATAVTGWHFISNLPGGPGVLSASGDFAVLAGARATFATPWYFNSGYVPAFWSTGGFTFDLTTSSITDQAAPTVFGPDRPLNGSVTVKGVGYVSGNGFEPTYCLWNFTTQDPYAGGTFSFSAGSLTQAATGAIGDFVWKDTNKNGIQDPGESGIDGVIVTLKDGSGTLIATTQTANNGYYQFTGLRADSYTVTVDTGSAALAGLFPSPVGASGSTPSNDSNPNPSTNVILQTDASTDQTIDFGFYALDPAVGVIGDFVWLDLNQDGIQQSSEAGINGVTIFLKDESGNIIGTTATAGNGGYQFSGLAAGTYSVTIDTSSPALAGFVPTFNGAPGSNSANDSNLNPTTVVLATNGSVNLTIDFGYIPAPNGSIGDFVWKDLNGDGQQDPGEPGIPNVTVKLYQGNNTSGPVLATTVTDVDGFYFFTGLSAGTYSVVVDTNSPNLANTTPTATNAVDVPPTEDSNPNPAVVTLPLNTSKDTSIDFGFVPNPTGKIGNFVWKDNNRNGIQDPGEPGINNVTVTLKDPYGNVLATTTTANNGMYQFIGLTAGNYVVQVDGTDADLTGLIPTVQNAAGSNTANDSNVNPALVTLATDSSVDLTIDFGFFGPGCGCIGDYIWKDLDCDGIQDCNEQGIKGVTVKLYWNNILVDYQVTNSSGRYLFSNLWAGTYTVVIDANQSALAGLSATKTGGTSNKATDSSSSPVVVSLATNKSCDMTIDFGFKKTLVPCPIVTCSPGSWNNKSNWFCKLLEDRFKDLYPCGLSIGAGKNMKFNCYDAVKKFLPCYGAGTCLRQNYCNPSTQLGDLPGHVVCLRLAVDCSKAGIGGPGLGNCKVKSGKFSGWTISQVLNLAESCIGGARLPANCSYKDIRDVCAALNDNYDLGKDLGKCNR